MRIATWIASVERLRPVLEAWQKENRAEEFGISITEEGVLGDLDALIKGHDSDVLVAMSSTDNEPVGFLGVFATESFLSKQRMAVEKYWYVLPQCRTAGYLLIEAAKKWAKDHKCSHLIMSASNLASDKYQKVCKFYHHVGLKLFETSFITEV